MFKALKWEDWVGVGLGIWLLASPWVFGFSDQTAPMMNALVMGCILILEEMLELGVHEAIEEWIDVVAGAWLIVSPLALGFTSHFAASVNTAAVGLFTLMFAVWAISPLDEKLGGWWREHAGH